MCGRPTLFSFKWLQLRQNFLQVHILRVSWCFLACCQKKRIDASDTRVMLCPSVSPANLYMSALSRQWGRNCLCLWPWKTGRAKGWTLRGVHRGGQKSNGKEMTEVICVWGTFCCCVFPARKKRKKEKCSCGIVQRLIAAPPGLQFSKYADAIPSAPT